MQDFSTVNVLKCKTQLHEPVHDFSLREMIFFLPLLLHMECQITHFTELHDNNQNTLINETSLIRDDIWMD